MDAINKLTCRLQDLLIEKVYARKYGLLCRENLDELICEVTSYLTSIEIAQGLTEEECSSLESYLEKLDLFIDSLPSYSDRVLSESLDCELLINLVSGSGSTCEETIEINQL